MANTVLVADCFDTYSLTLPLYQTPSPYVMSANSFNNYLPGGALNDSNHNVFSIVSAPAVGAVPWNTFGGNHYVNANCVQVGFPTANSASSNPGPGMYRTFGNVYQSLIWGQWIRFNTMPIGNVAFWRLCDGQNHTGGLFPQTYGLAHCFLQMSSAGTLALVNGGSAGTIGSTSISLSTLLNTWHFFEAFVYLGDHNGPLPVLNGNFTIKMDGAVLMSGTNVQTAFVSSGQGAGYNADTFTIDAEFDNTANIDFGPYYILPAPNAGAALATAKGVLFQTLFANANGSVDQLSVQGAASNFQAINGATPNPANYVFTSTAGQRDQYKFPIFSGFSSLFAVCPIVVAESDGAGSRVVTAVQQTAGEITGGAFGLVNGTYKYYETVFTGITPAQANTGEWGEQLLN